MANSKRSVVVDPEEVRRVRNSKGWTAAILAEKTDLSLRTIQKVEGGEAVSTATARVIAHALGVPYEVLVPTAATVRPNKLRAHLVFEFDIRDTANQEQLQAFLHLLTQFLPHPESVNLKDFSIGGKSITFDTSPENAYYLLTPRSIIQDDALEFIAETAAGDEYNRGISNSASQTVAMIIRFVTSFRVLIENPARSPDSRRDETRFLETQPDASTPAPRETQTDSSTPADTPPACSRFPEYRSEPSDIDEFLRWFTEAKARPSPEREERLAVLSKLFESWMDLKRR